MTDKDRRISGDGTGMTLLSRLLAATMLFLLPLAAAQAHGSQDETLAQAIASPHRSPAFVLRDAQRHPLQELRFFGLTPRDRVVEIWPGGGYWTEILVPYLKAHGHYTAALPPTGREAAAFQARFPQAATTVLGKGHYELAPPASVDLVLTFRNLHDWMETNEAPQVLAGFFAALKPGGTLGIEDHRARPDRLQDPQAASGYVRQDYAVSLARQAGFVFVGSSEIDANPKDTTSWPKGVWSLPPTYALGATDHARYAAIGEADNFVLKFRKP
jgi:predicted methyltransferase